MPTYKVANPRGIPKGIRILHNGSKEWHEGDAIVPGDVADFDELVGRGFIVKVGG